MPKYREAAKSELNSQRELLDSLMDMFVNTKMDEGPCDKIHSEEVKAAFEKSNDIYMFDNYIEREFLARLAESEKTIKRARQRVEEEKSDEELNPELNPEVINVHGEMSKIIQLAENFAEIGDIDNCFELMTKLEDLQKEKNGLINRINDMKRQRIGSGTDKKLRVCDVCGSFLSIFDSDKRLTDHFMGKQHIGFQYMRDVVAAIQKRRDERRANQSTSASVREEGSRSYGDRNDDRRRDDNYRRDNYGGGRRDDYNRGRYRDDYNRGRDNYRNGGGGGGGGGGYRDNSRGRSNRDNRRRSRSRS